jgi:uncharacterized membrane protein
MGLEALSLAASSRQTTSQEDWVRESLTFIAEHAIMIIQAMALVMVIIGTLQAFLRGIGALFSPSSAGHHFHSAYLQYARWLVGGLTFQLAADIIESTIAPTWDEIGRLGAIAVIRTFLNFFLERDLAEMERREAAANVAIARSP